LRDWDRCRLTRTDWDWEGCRLTDWEGYRLTDWEGYRLTDRDRDWEGRGEDMNERRSEEGLGGNLEA
jgi:hypothetical protein